MGVLDALLYRKQPYRNVAWSNSSGRPPAKGSVTRSSVTPSVTIRVKATIKSFVFSMLALHRVKYEANIDKWKLLSTDTMDE